MIYLGSIIGIFIVFFCFKIFKKIKRISKKVSELEKSFVDSSNMQLDVVRLNCDLVKDYDQFKQQTSGAIVTITDVLTKHLTEGRDIDSGGKKGKLN